MKTSEILKEARAHLVKYGWQQFQLGTRGHPCCAEGALVTAAPRGGVGAKYYYKALDYLNRAVGIGDEPLNGWNDAPGRTQDEVLEAFDWAIKLAEKEEPE